MIEGKRQRAELYYESNHDASLVSLGYRRSGDHGDYFRKWDRRDVIDPRSQRGQELCSVMSLGRDTARDRSGLLRGLTNLSELADSDSPCGFFICYYGLPHVQRHFQINRASWCGGSCSREVRCRRIKDRARQRWFSQSSNSCQSVT